MALLGSAVVRWLCVTGFRRVCPSIYLSAGLGGERRSYVSKRGRVLRGVLRGRGWWVSSLASAKQLGAWGHYCTGNSAISRQRYPLLPGPALWQGGPSPAMRASSMLDSARACRTLFCCPSDRKREDRGQRWSIGRPQPTPFWRGETQYARRHLPNSVFLLPLCLRAARE